MANTLKYTFRIIGEDSSAITFDDLDAAKDLVDFGGWTLPDSGVAWSLEDSDVTLVITITFADSDAGRTAQDAFHNNMKDTWTVTGSIDGSTLTEILQPDNSFTVTSIKDGEVDI